MSAVAVACSGGIDSRFLCHALRRAGFDVLALHARGVHVAEDDTRDARIWAQKAGIVLEEIEFQALALPEVRANGPRRCYFCKAGLVRCLRAALAQREAAGDVPRLLCDGSNADDLASCRPGIQALKEGDVFSPLAESGFTKQDIRHEGAATGLENPGQVARPCLLTRFAYGVMPEETILHRLAEAERELAALKNPDGLPLLGDFRVRLTPEPLLQAQHLPATSLPLLDAIMVRCGLAPWQSREDTVISGLYDRKTDV